MFVLWCIQSYKKWGIQYTSFHCNKNIHTIFVCVCMYLNQYSTYIQNEARNIPHLDGRGVCMQPFICVFTDAVKYSYVKKSIYHTSTSTSMVWRVFYFIFIYSTYRCSIMAARRREKGGGWFGRGFFILLREQRGSHMRPQNKILLISQITKIKWLLKAKKIKRKQIPWRPLLISPWNRGRKWENGQPPRSLVLQTKNM